MEEKKGKVLYVGRVEVNGIPEKYNDFYKFNVTIDNGDVGLMYTKSDTAPVKIGDVIEYEKKTGTSSKGPYTTIKLKTEKIDKYDKYKKNTQLNIGIKCAEIAANLSLAPDVDKAIANFTKSFEIVNKLVTSQNGSEETTAKTKMTMDQATFAFVKSLFAKYKTDVSEPDKIMIEIVNLLSKYEIPEDLLK